jgi:glycosyltransferase involved in cell wall biosynthesis
MASWLSALGVDMGQRLLPPDKGNPRGYFEDIDFLEFQRKVLSSCCLADDGGHPDWGWTESEQLNRDRFRDFIPCATTLLGSRDERRGLWGWKDPRTTLLLDFWDALLDGPLYIFLYRFPWEVADSMQRLGQPVFLRNPEYAYRIWCFYNRHLRDFFIKNSHRCVLLSINALQQNPDRFVDFLRKKLNLRIPEANLRDLYEHELFTSIEGSDPLIDLVAATSPQCTKLLAQLDNLADLSGSGLWRERPLRSRLNSQSNTSAPYQVDVSLIIPCFNHGQFLIEAIASLERVAPKNCDLIVVNDGSKEPRTLEILKILRSAGYFVFDQVNQGLSAARNGGIDLARGRYILPLDADNRVRAGFIEDGITVLDSSSEVGIVYGYRQFFGMRTGLDQVPEFDLEEMLTFNYIDACAMFRKQVWADCGGYDQSISPLEDWELWINAAEKGWRFHRLPQVTFEYRVRPESLLSKVDDAQFLDQVLERIMTKHYELYQPRLVKQLAQMKRLSIELGKKLNRLHAEIASNKESLISEVK